MKNKITKYALYGLTLFLAIGTTSCDSDDDLPVGPVLTVNSFCYGTNAESSFISTAAYNEEVEEVTSGIFRTSALITDDNLTVDNSGVITGMGALINLDLYGNRNMIFQAGTYIIGNTTEVGDVVVSYSPEFDGSQTLNTAINLVDGIVAVNPYRTGYAIEIDGEDVNGDRFHGIYLGNVTPVN